MVHSLIVNLRLFWQGTLLSYIALFHWLRPTTYLASKILSPLAQILFFTFLGVYATGRDNASFYVIGNAIQIAAMSGIYGVTMSIGGDRWNGTLPYLFGTPANRLFMFLGRSFVHIIDGVLGVIIGLLWGVLLLGVDLSHANLAALGLDHPDHHLQHLGVGAADGMCQPCDHQCHVCEQLGLLSAADLLWRQSPD